MAVASYSIWRLYGYYRTYQDGKEEYDQLTEYVDENESLPTNEKNGQKSRKKKCPIRVDFDSLRKINPDIVGWIYIPNTV